MMTIVVFRGGIVVMTIWGREGQEARARGQDRRGMRQAVVLAERASSDSGIDEGLKTTMVRGRFGLCVVKSVA